jgi:hypothetical protein
VIKLEEKENKEGKKEVAKKGKRFPTIFVVLIVLVLAGAIGARFFYKGIKTKISNYLLSKSLSKQTGAEVKIEGDGDKVTYKGEDFEFSYDNGEGLPEGFPKDFPIYSNSKLISKWSSTAEGNEGMSVVMESQDSVEKISNFYKTEFTSKGWTVISTFSQDDSTVFSFEKDKIEGVLGITDAEDKVSISITIGNK